MAKKYDDEDTPAFSDAPSKASALETFTVAELAQKHGQIQPAHVGDDPYLVWHNVAAALNGWGWHALHVDAQFKLSSADYLGALEAAKLGKPHAPANLNPDKGGSK